MLFIDLECVEIDPDIHFSYDLFMGNWDNFV
jgi:hypothetical protein